MYYNNRGWRRRYRRPGLFGFPWLLVVIFVIATHSIWGIIAGVFLALVISGILSAVLNSQRGGGFGQWGPNNYQQYTPNQSYTEPYQPPADQGYYQPNTPYQSYDQGYQASQESYQEGEKQYPYPQQNEAYQPYEQPQANYPQQMPPQQQ